MSTISFDGVRLTYVGDMGAFWLYAWQTESEMFISAKAGCATWREAETALAECVAYLELMAAESTEEVA